MIRRCTWLAAIAAAIVIGSALGATAAGAETGAGIFGPGAADPGCEQAYCPMATMNGLGVAGQPTITTASLYWQAPPQREIPLLGYWLTLSYPAYHTAFRAWGLGADVLAFTIRELTPGTEYRATICPAVDPRRYEMSCAEARFKTRSLSLATRTAARRSRK